FDRFGNPLSTPLVRQNPDVTGPDGGNNTFFGADSAQDDDMPPPGYPLPEFPNFFGTSAATPHVAGLAALILDNATSPISPALMERILEETAIDILSDTNGPIPGGEGFDFKSGFGLVQAADANGAVCADLDNDGLCINEDRCPLDPNKTEPG